jgi:pilus assembly protein CpaE
MPVYLLNADGDEGALVEIEQRLKLAIPDLKRIAKIEDIGPPSLKGAARSIAITVAPWAEKGEDFGGLIDIVKKRQRDVFFVVLGGDLSARDYKQLIQSGNADWVSESGATQEILGIVARVSATRTAAANQSIVASFLPSAGGVGNSTLAIETAIQLVRRKPANDGRIALVDLDFQSSHVCDYLDVAPKFQIAEIIDEPSRLDDQLLEVFASRHSSGLDIFAAPRNHLHARDLGVEALSALFDRMAQHYAFVVVDLPVSAHVWTIPLLIASEGILVTGVNTIPGLRQVAETTRAVRAEARVKADARIVINRCEFGLFGRPIRGEHVARVLGEEERFYVRNTSLAVECVNRGESLTMARPSDKAVKDIAAIADFCMALKPMSARQGSPAPPIRVANPTTSEKRRQFP